MTQMTAYFYDTEFIEGGHHRPIHLISIGMACEDGRTLYAQNLDCPFEAASDWVKQNVYPHLVDFNLEALCPVQRGVGNGDRTWYNFNELARLLRAFVFHTGPRLWAYYADYDHVVLSQVFGTMINLPAGWPRYTRDIKQLCDALGNPKLPEKEGTQHHALNDALWNLRAFHYLKAYYNHESMREDLEVPLNLFGEAA